MLARSWFGFTECPDFNQKYYTRLYGYNIYVEYTISPLMAFSRTCLIIYFLVHLILCVASMTFNLTDIGPRSENLEIVTEGAAYITSDGIQLTPAGYVFFEKIAGRATYIRPLHLWDRKSGQLASFSTNFTFVINSHQGKIYGGGLTFFLAQNNSVITGGSALGLPLSNNKSMSPFVAVEFVTGVIPSSDHVGISINSPTSVGYKNWLSNVPGGGLSQAWITYDSVSKNLTVSFTGFQNNTAVRQDGLVYTVDMRNELPEWVIFGFSGSASGSPYYQSNLVISWSFLSSDFPTKVKNMKVRLIVGMWVAIMFMAVLIFVMRRWKRKKSWENEEDEHEFDVEMNKVFEMGTGPKRISYQKLVRSTCNFAENQKLGEGGFGGVYKGFFKESSTHVAVKRVSTSSRQGIKEYASEVMIISRLRHRNLVQLIGWCHENRELLLVYEFMENGSLDLHLFKEKSLLAWDTRNKIAHGLGSALLYLHEEWEQCVLHRDIKSSNVMLDSHFNPKLGDFGLAKLVEHEKGTQTTMLAGTMGYMAPECVVTGKVSKESDVYSFGVVTLEIASGRRTIVYTAEERQTRLVEWVWELYGTRTLVEAADPRLGSDFDEEELKRLIVVGLWCAHPDPDLRPSMRQAIQVLKCEAPLPKLPSHMLVATYSAPPMSWIYGVTSIIQDQLVKL
ncbi:putative protein kinase RLK-Pelle-L-LEC family [Helianthus annuus]|nr:putative protein kinase RLK-Pelle-L-LEC family [Helianthus annuus]KAJ0638335.1 putative protein kinase RLK-Pelle-L-LEC family [Helianthus annuus]KAJ0892237.1 putative protein kinase RLK-Pelle-L-LEC family [Helianthus annuus]KAJ0892244.1 putative protein kinase RLK-Pelle-L-LEC family [Helianthus annuus]